MSVQVVVDPSVRTFPFPAFKDSEPAILLLFPTDVSFFTLDFILNGNNIILIAMKMMANNSRR